MLKTNLDIVDADAVMEGLFNFCGDIAEADGTPLRWFCSLFDRFRSISFSMISFMVRAEPI